jgi:hypothetical protein
VSSGYVNRYTNTVDGCPFVARRRSRLADQENRFPFWDGFWFKTCLLSKIRFVKYANFNIPTVLSCGT